MSLGEKLDAIRANAEQRIPPESLALMHRATQELEDSGAANNVIRPGAKLPAFSLRNQYGDGVTSNEVLSHGPLVLTVYRGLW